MMQISEPAVVLALFGVTLISISGKPGTRFRYIVAWLLGCVLGWVLVQRTL